MFAFEINKRLKKYKHFIGSFSIDKLPLLNSKPSSLIINLDPAYKPGSHWVAVYFPHYAPSVFFDPLGNLPSPLITSFLDKNSTHGWISFDLKIQPENSFLCGYYCVEFIKSCPNYRKFFEMFSNCDPNNDSRMISKIK